MRLLQRLDNLGSSLVPLLYLLAAVSASAYYFSDGHIGAVAIPPWLVGILLAGAVELHSFLQQRRMRVAYADLSAAKEPQARLAASKAFRTHLAMVGGLVLFQIFASIAFLSETWTPAPGLPAWLQILVRGTVTPALFLLAGFLTPVAESPAALLQRGTADVLEIAVNASLGDWRKDIVKARKRGTKLTGLMTALLRHTGDAESAGLVQTIASELYGEPPQVTVIEEPQTAIALPTEPASDADTSDEDAPPQRQRPAQSRPDGRTAQAQERRRRLAIVRAMMAADEHTSVSDIMRRLGVARSTAHSLQVAAISAEPARRRARA
jgi:hypothetical protein